MVKCTHKEQERNIQQMTLKQLFDYLDSRIAMCHLTSDRKARSDLRHQAYGAVDLFITTNQAGAQLAEILWEDSYSAQFEELIYGE